MLHCFGPMVASVLHRLVLVWIDRASVVFRFGLDWLLGSFQASSTRLSLNQCRTTGHAELSNTFPYTFHSDGMAQ